MLSFQYDDNKEIMTIFDKGIETLRYQVACFDMSSILIKPVQRILKYPLLLNELMKVSNWQNKLFLNNVMNVSFCF